MSRGCNDDIIRRTKDGRFDIEILDDEEDDLTVNLVNHATGEIIQRRFTTESITRRLFTKRMREGREE